MVLSAQDIWEEYSDAPMRKPKRSQPKVEIKGNELTAKEKQLLRLTQEPRRAEDLLLDPDLAWDAATLSAQLTMLEIRGYLRQLPGNSYQTVTTKIKA